MTILTNMKNVCVVLPMCAIGKGRPIVDWWWKFISDGGLGSPIGPHPRCGTAGTYLDSC